MQYLNLPFKYVITSLFLYPLLFGAPSPLGALRVRVVCLWVNPALWWVSPHNQFGFYLRSPAVRMLSIHYDLLLIIT